MKTITIVGLGYVGLPLACLCSWKSLKVYGLDVDSRKVDLINKNQSPIRDDYVESKLKRAKIIATTDANVSAAKTKYYSAACRCPEAWFTR